MPSPGTNDTAKDSGSKSNEAVTFGKAKRRPVAAVKGSPPPEASPKPKMKRAPDQAMAQTVKPTPKRMAPKKPAPFRPSPTVAEPVSASSPAEADKSPYRWDTRFTLALIILVVGINLTLTLLFGRHDDAIWHPKALQLSALHGQGVDKFWAAVNEFRTLQTANGKLALRRQQQSLAWMWERIDTGLKQAFRQHPQVQQLLPQLTQEVLEGRMAASTAARNLLLARTNRA